MGFSIEYPQRQDLNITNQEEVHFLSNKYYETLLSVFVRVMLWSSCHPIQICVSRNQSEPTTS